MGSKRVYITMPESFLREVNKLAQKEGRSRADVIREALRTHMADSNNAKTGKPRRNELWEVFQEAWAEAAKYNYDPEQVEKDVLETMAEVREERNKALLKAAPKVAKAGVG